MHNTQEGDRLRVTSASTITHATLASQYSEVASSSTQYTTTPTAILESHQIKAIYNQYCTESLLLNIPRSKAKTALLNNIIVTS